MIRRHGQTIRVLQGQAPRKRGLIQIGKWTLGRRMQMMPKSNLQCSPSPSPVGCSTTSTG